MSRSTDKKSATESSGGVRITPALYGASLKKTSNSDAKGRVVLGPQHANKMFRVSEQPDGNLLLEPLVAIHEREIWFYKNPEVQAMVQKGIRQSKAGRGKYLGSFAEFAEGDADED